MSNSYSQKGLGWNMPKRLAKSELKRKRRMRERQLLQQGHYDRLVKSDNRKELDKIEWYYD